MNWEDAQYFLAAAKQGSFAAAGALLKVSHTTVSRRITALETDLGARLLERARTPFGLTPAGERFMETAVVLEQGFIDLERGLAGEDAQLSGTLRITAPHLLLNYLLMPYLAGFQDKWPDVELQLVAAYAGLNLTRREADIAIRLTNEPPENLIGRNLGVVTWSVYAHQELLSGNGRQQELSYVGIDDDRPVPAALQERCKTRLSMRVNDYTTLVPAVLAGAGAGLLPDFLGKPHSELEKMTVMPEQSVALWLLTHPDLRHVRRVSLFLDFIQAGLAAHFPRNKC